MPATARLISLVFVLLMPGAVLAQAANAPASLKADFQTVESALVTYISAVKNLHLKSGQTPSIQQLPKLEEALKAIQTPAFTAAQTRISTWETKNCG